MESFELKGLDWSQLSQVPATVKDDEFIDSHIGDMALKAFGPNPALRQHGILLLEQRLVSGERIALWQIRNLLELSVDSKEVTARNANKLQLAIFCICAGSA